MGFSWPGVFLLGASGRTGRFFTQLLFHNPHPIKFSLPKNLIWLSLQGLAFFLCQLFNPQKKEDSLFFIFIKDNKICQLPEMKMDSWLKKIIWVIGVLRRTVVSDWRFDNLCRSHLQTQVASARVVETSVTNNSPSQDSNHPDDLFQSRYVTPEFKPFSKLIL